MDELWRASVPRCTPANGVIAEQGLPADHVILLLRGRATSVANTVHGRSVELGSWTAPAALDKVATFAGSAHPGTIVATETAWWCLLPRNTMNELLDRHPDVRRHVLRLVAEAAHQARTSFVDVSARPSLSRLAVWLLGAAEHDVVALPRPQDHLAHRLGMTRVTLNRALHRLAKAGVITLDAKGATIRDTEGLRAIADGSSGDPRSGPR